MSPELKKHVHALLQWVDGEIAKENRTLPVPKYVHAAHKALSKTSGYPSQDVTDVSSEKKVGSS